MKRRYLIAAGLALAILLAWFPGQSQEPAKSPYISSPRRALTAPELLDAPDEWLQRSLGWANEIFNTFPPAVPEPPVRRAALIRLDDILHIEKAPEKPLVQQFFRSRIRKAIGEIEATRVNDGMRIWVDVLLPNCWTDDIKRVARGVNPRLIITGHENEMGHTVDHREDYTQTYNHLFGTQYPFLVMTWGESYHYRR